MNGERTTEKSTKSTLAPRSRSHGTRDSSIRAVQSGSDEHRHPSAITRAEQSLGLERDGGTRVVDERVAPTHGHRLRVRRAHALTGQNRNHVHSRRACCAANAAESMLVRPI